MPIGIALLRSVRSADLVDPFEYGHHDLLVELRTLSEIDFAVEIFHFKHFRSSFRRESDELRRIDLGESVIIEEFPHGLFHKHGEFEGLHVFRMSENDNFIVMDSLSVSIDDIFGDIYRTRIDDFPDDIHIALLQFETEFPFRHLCHRSRRCQDGSHQATVEFLDLFRIFDDHLR